MNTKTSWVFGNFLVEVALTATGLEPATPEAAKNVEGVLAGYGLQVLQRKPASAVEKTLAGYEKRPKGFKRDSIAYGEAAAATVKSGFTLDIGNGVTAECITVTEHVAGEMADSKFTEEREICSRHESKGDLEVWLVDTVKYDGETHNADDADDAGEFSLEMLRAVRAFKIARLAAIKADI